MAKITIDENAFVYPMSMVVVGTLVDERPNFMAVGWVTRVNFTPPLKTCAGLADFFRVHQVIIRPITLRNYFS